jgi:hypothetical protein
MTSLTYLAVASQISTESTGTREAIPLLLPSVRVLQLEGLTVRQLAGIKAPQVEEIKNNLLVEVELGAAARQVRLEVRGAQLWSLLRQVQLSDTGPVRSAAGNLGQHEIGQCGLCTAARYTRWLQVGAGQLCPDRQKMCRVLLS